jgi:hypothetical protein
MADNNNQLSEIAVMHAEIKQVSELLIEIKEDFKDYKQSSDTEINDLKTRVSKSEQDIKILELKLANMEKRWDIPNKILITVLTAIATAVITLILK